MPIKYVQSMGVAAGIVQTVNEVQITCRRPALALSASGKPAWSKSAMRRPSLALTMTPTLKPSYGGD